MATLILLCDENLFEVSEKPIARLIACVVLHEIIRVRRTVHLNKHFGVHEQICAKYNAQRNFFYWCGSDFMWYFTTFDDIVNIIKYYNQITLFDFAILSDCILRSIGPCQCMHSMKKLSVHQTMYALLQNIYKEANNDLSTHQAVSARWRSFVCLTNVIVL